MKVRMQLHGGTVSNARKRAGMEAINHEREEEWLGRMDTILIFVCLTTIDFRSN